MNMNRWHGMACLMVLTGVLVTAAVAQTSGSVDVFLFGVDSYCSPLDENGSLATTTKLYKNYNTGVLTLIACGQVTNDCGCLVKLSDQGVVIVDPDTRELLTATKDIEVIARPRRCKCKCSSCTNLTNAVLVACFQPGTSYDSAVE